VLSLVPGDTLIVHAGDYVDSGKIWIGVDGTADRPVLITGAPGENRPRIMRSSASNIQNTINIEDANFVTIRGLEIMGNGADGIKLFLYTETQTNTDITLEDLVIHGVVVGINSQASVARLTIRDTRIYDTGMNGATNSPMGGSHGGAMNLGCWTGSCSVSDSVIENNWIHDTQIGRAGYGIELRTNSFGNIIRNNVIYNTGSVGVVLYGTGGQARNVVEGNAFWNCLEGGVQVAADAIVRNNLIFNSGFGLRSTTHNGVIPGNLDIVHNTIVNAGTSLYIRDWSGRDGIIFANNAIYGSFDSADVGGGTFGVEMVGNVVFPGAGTLPGGSYVIGNGMSDFQAVDSFNVYPASGSALIGAGSSLYSPDDDFDGRGRVGVVIVGAYRWVSGESPLWEVTGGFKTSP